MLKRITQLNKEESGWLANFFKKFSLVVLNKNISFFKKKKNVLYLCTAYLAAPDFGGACGLPMNSYLEPS